LGRLGQEQVGWDKDVQRPQAHRHRASLSTVRRRLLRKLVPPYESGSTLGGRQQTGASGVLSKVHFRPGAQMRNHFGCGESTEPGTMIERPAGVQPI